MTSDWLTDCLSTVPRALSELSTVGRFFFVWAPPVAGTIAERFLTNIRERHIALPNRARRLSLPALMPSEG